MLFTPEWEDWSDSKDALHHQPPLLPKPCSNESSCSNVRELQANKTDCIFSVNTQKQISRLAGLPACIPATALRDRNDV